MIYFFVLVAAFFCGVSWLRKKYYNPHTLTYIFGLKGAGKSTFMAYLMLRDIKNGWTVYTNMSDCKIPGVRIFDSKDLKSCYPPPHSSIYIDEAGLVWDNRKYASFSDGYVEYFKYQRKVKNKVTMNSQALDVDKKIRDLIDYMYLMTSVLGCIGVARPLRRTIKPLEATGNSESRLAMNIEFEGLTKFRFLWLPKYWKWFDSFNCPPRPQIPYKAIPGSVQRLDLRQQFVHLKKQFFLKAGR